MIGVAGLRSCLVGVGLVVTCFVLTCLLLTHPVVVFLALRAQELSGQLGGDRAVAGELGSGAGSLEERQVGDDQADLDVDAVHDRASGDPLVELVDRQLVEGARVAGGLLGLGGRSERLVDSDPLRSRQPGGQQRHHVGTRPQRQAAVLGGLAGTLHEARRVHLVDQGAGGCLDLLAAGSRKTGGQPDVDLGPVAGLQGGGGLRDDPGLVRGDGPLGQGRQGVRQLGAQGLGAGQVPRSPVGGGHPGLGEVVGDRPAGAGRGDAGLDLSRDLGGVEVDLHPGPDGSDRARQQLQLTEQLETALVVQCVQCPVVLDQRGPEGGDAAGQTLGCDTGRQPGRLEGRSLGSRGRGRGVSARSSAGARGNARNSASARARSLVR